MINILFAYNHLLVRGGTESVMVNIFDNIDHKKFHIDFLLLHDNQIEDTTEISRCLKEKGSQIFYVPPIKNGYIQYKRSLNEFFQFHQYDIVHTHMNALGADVLKAAKKNKVPVRIAHSHNTGHQLEVKNIKDILHYLFLEEQRFQIRHIATNYIGCSEKAGNWLFGRKIVRNKTTYMMFKNAVNIEKYEFNPLIREKIRKEYSFNDKFVIGHVGRFDYQKNHPFLIQVVKKLCENNKNIILMLVGTGNYLKKIQLMVKQLDLQQNVIFMGNRSDVPELLQAMDLFVLPSHFEGLPVSLIEAQVSGLRCIVSDKVSSQSNISNNVRFLGIEEKDIDKWVTLTQEVMDHSYKRETPIFEIRKNGYDMKYNIKNLEKFYLNALKEN